MAPLTWKCGAFLQPISFAHWRVRRTNRQMYCTTWYCTRLVDKKDWVRLWVRTYDVPHHTEPISSRFQRILNKLINTYIVNISKHLWGHILFIYENLLYRFWSIFNLTFAQSMTLFFVRCQLSSVTCLKAIVQNQILPQTLINKIISCRANIMRLSVIIMLSPKFIL